MTKKERTKNNKILCNLAITLFLQKKNQIFIKSMFKPLIIHLLLKVQIKEYTLTMLLCDINLF